MTPADVALVREAGGLGDVLRLGSVSRALKRRGTKRVTAYGLRQYQEVLERLDGIDEFLPVRITNLRNRRPRSSDWRQAEYLRKSVQPGHDQLVDLFCPGYVYEMRNDPVRYSRAEIFCAMAGIELGPSCKEGFGCPWVTVPSFRYP